MFVRYTRSVGLVLYVLAGAATLLLPVRSDAPKSRSVLDTPLVLRKSKFDLRDRDRLPEVVKALDAEIDYYSAQRGDTKAKKKSARKGGEEARPKPERPDLKHVVRALKEMRRTAKDMEEERIAYDDGARKMLELDWTMLDEFQRPFVARESLDLTQMPYRLRSLTLNAVGRGSGHRPSVNLASYESKDLSRVDPVPSSFWYKPGRIEEKDLFHGYGRESIPSIAGQICEYDGAHTGYGFHPSFDVRTPDGHRWHVKFGEQSSAAFGSRVMWALGYPAQISDYCQEVRVKWDRRIFTEFNDRSLNSMIVKFAGLRLWDQTDFKYQSPFPFVRYAVMKDGSQISTKELRNGLFGWLSANRTTRDRKVYNWGDDRWDTVTEPLPPVRYPDASAKNYDKAFEEKIDYLVMTDVNLRSKDGEEGVEQLGDWDFNYLDHPDLRELRGMALVQAWLDNWDIREGNNRLRIVKNGKGPARLEHVVADMGALFGNSGGIFRFHDGALRGGLFQDSPNAFTWVYTHPQAPRDMTVPVANYMPISKTEPFYRMNMDDARWMARLMGRLSENQIRLAFIGSGYDAATARLLLEKLASRRDHMIRDLGLAGEVPLWRPHGEVRTLSYDPLQDGPFEATMLDGIRVKARIDPTRYIAHGKLRLRKA